MKINSIYCGDNLQIMRQFSRESIDLIYLDPPFFTQRDFKTNIAGFSDRWKGMDSYLVFVKERIIECHRLLKDTGSIYLHCDWHANHRLRCLLDDVFGENNFVNEIIYKSGPKKNDKNKQKFSVQHNTLLFYKKEHLKKINTYTEHNPEYVKKMYTHKDNKGVFRTAPLSCETKSGGYAKQKVFLFEGINKRWIYSMKTLKNLKAGNRIYKTKTGNIRKKVYLSESKGRALSTLWEDIPIYLSYKEKVGYPTQKPLVLLERIIKASSNEGDLVLDPFCGSGTTCIASERLNRKWIGIDLNEKAVEIVKKRLQKEVSGQIEMKV